MSTQTKPRSNTKAVRNEIARLKLRPDPSETLDDLVAAAGLDDNPLEYLALRAEIAAAGVTAESAGMPIDGLVVGARAAEDRAGWLAMYSAAEPVLQEETRPAKSPIGDAEIQAAAANDPAAIREELQKENSALQMENSMFLAAGGAMQPEDAARLVIELRDLGKVPLGEVPQDQVDAGKYYLTEHFEVGGLSRAQGTGLRRLFLGLEAQGERLAAGRRVASQPDAIRWLLERMA
jgi:hypothetical protein